jgi:hypothetical protein
LPPLRIRGCECQIERRVPHEQHAELASRVPAGAKDSDRKFMHKECITLQNWPVNLSCARTAAGRRRLVRLAGEAFQPADYPVAGKP